MPIAFDAEPSKGCFQPIQPFISLADRDLRSILHFKDHDVLIESDRIDISSVNRNDVFEGFLFFAKP